MNNFKEKLKDFNPEKLYPIVNKNVILENMVLKAEKSIIIDLLVYMIENNASENELLRIIRYSMCVISAKHNKIDLKSAYKDQNIDELVKKYYKN